MKQNSPYQWPTLAPSSSGKPSAPATGLASPDPGALHEAARALLAPGRGPVHAVSGSDNVRRVTHEWTAADRRGRIRARISSFRMKYDVPPGLYALGDPDASSEVFVSANYKLSFDILRRALEGVNAWILVLDTKGINVWCAAGKGTFGTTELVRRIHGVRLPERVSHRRIIVPQLGASGVRASEVKRATGFKVHFGPVDARDIISYVDNGYRADPAMRRVRFGLADRLVLTPMELRQSMKYGVVASLAILALFGLQPHGIIYATAWAEGRAYIAFLFTAIITGALVTPALLPVIPFRSFALKGWLAGAAAVAPLVLATPLGGGSLLYGTAALIVFPLLSSYLALQFTGASTYTGPSGVKRELKVVMPLYVTGAAAALILLALYKIKTWGLL